MSVRGIRVHVYVLEQGHTCTKKAKTWIWKWRRSRARIKLLKPLSCQIVTFAISKQVSEFVLDTIETRSETSALATKNGFFHWIFSFSQNTRAPSQLVRWLSQLAQKLNSVQKRMTNILFCIWHPVRCALSQRKNINRKQLALLLKAHVKCSNRDAKRLWCLHFFFTLTSLSNGCEYGSLSLNLSFTSSFGSVLAPASNKSFTVGVWPSAVASISAVRPNISRFRERHTHT